MSPKRLLICDAPSKEVIASTFDEQATRHVTAAEMVIEKAKRLVEHKRDVILLDNITRQHELTTRQSPLGKILSVELTPCLHKPKRFLGAARNIEHGELKIIASALIESLRMEKLFLRSSKDRNNEIVSTGGWLKASFPLSTSKRVVR